MAVLCNELYPKRKCNGNNRDKPSFRGVIKSKSFTIEEICEIQPCPTNFVKTSAPIFMKILHEQFSPSYCVTEGRTDGLGLYIEPWFHLVKVKSKGKGKGHPCTGTEALYRPYGL